MSLSRRQFCQWLGGSGLLAEAASRSEFSVPLVAQAGTRQAEPGSHIGSLYPFVQRQADRSSLDLSFLRPEFSDLAAWQTRARSTVLERLFYEPPATTPDVQMIRREEHDGYVQEYLTFQTTPDLRVPAYVLIPSDTKLPAPAIVALHCHGGFYLWGKEKLVEAEHEHPPLTDYKRELYQGKSIASELARRGYVVIVIDAFYWGERRMLLDEDPESYRDPRTMTKADVTSFNRRSQDGEQLVARSLLAAGITWPGVLLWDDLRTVDYLVSRPEVDPQRVGCVGLSLGGYRSFLLAALDPRIKAAVDVGWMTSFGSQIKRHVINTIGFSFHIAGLYRYLDLPDLAALIAPRSLLVINGSRDALFSPDGVRAAFAKIAACFQKAGAAEHQRCRLYDAPHQFNIEMQNEAFGWLAQSLRG